MQRLFTALLGLVAISIPGLSCAQDWITAPSYYTHDPQTGERVQQYSPIGPFYTYQRTDFVRSGYRHLRSTIQAGSGADNLHVVEQWGLPVRPYEEWRFPFRPYSAPFPLTGPAYPGQFWGGGFFPPFPMPFNTYPLPGQSGARGANGWGRDPQWTDGYYPPTREPRMPDRQFYQTPPFAPHAPTPKAPHGAETE